MPGRPRYGCGHRKAGYIYSVGLTKEEMAVNNLRFVDFLIDPTWLVDPARDLGLSAQGVRILPRPDGSNIYDIYDWIGEEHYEYAPDFIMEADNLLGTSRLVDKGTPNLGMLTPESRHFFGFPKGQVVNFDPLWNDYLRELPCPTKQAMHNCNDKLWCTGLLWEATFRSRKKPYPTGIERKIKIPMPRNRKDAYGEPVSPEFYYAGAVQPETMDREWLFGFCYWQPIPRLEVVYDAIAGTHELAVKALQDCGCQIPFTITEE